MNERLSSQWKLFSYCQVQKRIQMLFSGIHRASYTKELIPPLQLCCLFGIPSATSLKHFNKSSLLYRSYKAGRKLQVAFLQPSYMLQLWVLRQSLPILKESGPPAVLLTNMAKKSRSTQAVSIFYESSWVLPRGCPCHSHLKQDRKFHASDMFHQQERAQAPKTRRMLVNLPTYSTVHVLSGSLWSHWESVSLGDSCSLFFIRSEYSFHQQ